jgi:hypothetical protein
MLSADGGARSLFCRRNILTSMNRADFTSFVQQTLEDVVRYAEEHTGSNLPRPVAFQWLGDRHKRNGAPLRVGIVEAIVERVYIDEQHIYPCVDIGVGDILDDGTPLVVANVAGYGPRPFQKNWTDRQGPFVYIIGQPFLEKLKAQTPSSGGAFGFLIPDMNKLRRS